MSQASSFLTPMLPPNRCHLAPEYHQSRRIFHQRNLFAKRHQRARSTVCPGGAYHANSSHCDPSGNNIRDILIHRPLDTVKWSLVFFLLPLLLLLSRRDLLRHYASYYS
ncbi:hypothetical protein BDV19DRAFT_253827 [Aspergillus venezuelensis]